MISTSELSEAVAWVNNLRSIVAKRYEMWDVAPPHVDQLVVPDTEASHKLQSVEAIDTESINLHTKNLPQQT
jgi:hypothetical protein